MDEDIGVNIPPHPKWTMDSFKDQQEPGLQFSLTCSLLNVQEH